VFGNEMRAGRDVPTAVDFHITGPEVAGVEADSAQRFPVEAQDQRGRSLNGPSRSSAS